MILDNNTKQEYGYSPSDLSYGSKKNIIVKCDYCNKKYISSHKKRLSANKVLDKDCCINCRFKKRAEVYQLKHGVDNPSKKPEVKEKIRKANSKRLKSKEFKEQYKQTMLEKYGVEHPMHSQELKEKQSNTVKEKYGVKNISQLPENRSIAVKNIIKTKIKNGSIQLYQGQTLPKIADDTGFSHSHFRKLVHKYGLDKAMTLTPKETCIERTFKEWFIKENINYISQYKVENRIADFYLPDFEVIIEADGLYWHSDASDRMYKSYHKEKRDIYLLNGYHPFFFRQHEIDNQFHIIKSIILNKMNKSNKIGARKCVVEEIDYNIGQQFLMDNHLMGRGKGKFVGLKYDNELVSLISIKRIKGGYEISRFCNKVGISVIGGLSRLLKYINVKPLTTFIDLRYGSGEYLSTLGFTYKNTYLSFKWTDGQNVFNRMKFPGKSGYDKGLYRLWDCGQAKWISV